MTNLDERAICFGENASLGHPLNKAHGLPAKNRARPDAEPATKLNRTLKLPRVAGKPVQNRQSETWTVLNQIQHVCHRPSRMQADQAPSRCCAGGEDRAEYLNLHAERAAMLWASIESDFADVTHMLNHRTKLSGLGVPLSDEFRMEADRNPDPCVAAEP